MNFNDEDIDTIPNPNTVYKCSRSLESSGMTYLMKLCMMTNKYSHLNNKIDDYLFNNKDELNKKNTAGWTALMLASRNSNTDSTEETVKLLLENSADINLQSNGGWTALICASLNSSTDSTEGTVKLLLENSADINLQSKSGRTALMYASRYSGTYSTEETVKLLLENNANVNLQSSDGSTALIYASKYSGTETTEGTVKLLLKKHIRKEYNLVFIISQIKNIENYSPLNWYIKKLVIIQHNRTKFI